MLAILLQNKATSKEPDPLDDSETFVIEANLLPDYIPVRVAQKILFIGESIRMFNSSEPGLMPHSGKSVYSGTSCIFR